MVNKGVHRSAASCHAMNRIHCLNLSAVMFSICLVGACNRGYREQGNAPFVKASVSLPHSPAFHGRKELLITDPATLAELRSFFPQLERDSKTDDGIELKGDVYITFSREDGSGVEIMAYLDEGSWRHLNGFGPVWWPTERGLRDFLVKLSGAPDHSITDRPQ
jgi:hypothetical protein